MSSGGPAVPSSERPPVIGIVGGAFNPVHLGHVLLAVTVKETKHVDQVIMVPVFKHPVKHDLLPFEDRVAMCQLAVQGKGIAVSTVEQAVGESNVVMLRALRGCYPAGMQLLWVCGDDVFDWIDNPKGQAMMKELDGLIVQRRLHQAHAEGADSFYKSPMDTARVAALMERHRLKIDFIFGELPHFSSTLVRSSPASWKAYLPRSVASYLDARPHLLAQLVASSGGQPGPGTSLADEQRPVKQPKQESTAVRSTELHEVMTSCVMRGLAVVHGIQKERGRTALALALRDKEALEALHEARAELDQLLWDLPSLPDEDGEAYSMMEELKYTHTWLTRDRMLLDRYLGRSPDLEEEGAGGWFRREAMSRKYNSRIDVLIEACAQVLGAQVARLEKGPPQDADERGDKRRWWSRDGFDEEDLEVETNVKSMLRLFRQWIRCKEALGRERAFVCAGGQWARDVVRTSITMRSRLGEVIEHKDLMFTRVFSVSPAKASSFGCSDVLHAMLARITAWEWSLQRCFAVSTPLRVLHHALALEEEVGLVPAAAGTKGSPFDILGWFNTTSSAIDIMLELVQGLAAAICASVAPERPA